MFVQFYIFIWNIWVVLKPLKVWNQSYSSWFKTCPLLYFCFTACFLSLNKNIFFWHATYFSILCDVLPVLYFILLFFLKHFILCFYFRYECCCPLFLSDFHMLLASCPLKSAQILYIYHGIAHFYHHVIYPLIPPRPINTLNEHLMVTKLQ